MSTGTGLTFEQINPDPVATNYVPKYGEGEVWAHPILAPERMVAGPYYRYHTWTFGDDFISPDYVETRWREGARPNKMPAAPTGTSSGYVQSHALEGEITDDERKGAVSGVIIESQRVRAITNTLRLRRELDVYTLINTTTNTYTISTKWDASGATIQADWLGMIAAFQLQCGVSPNWVVIPIDITNHLATTSEIRDLTKYTNPNMLIDTVLPPVLWSVPVVTPGKLVNAANPGATPSIARVWPVGGKKIWMGYSDPAASVDNQALTWALSAGNRNQGFPDNDVLIETQRAPYESQKKDIYTGYTFYDLEETASACVLEATVMT
jgi:hypothetical protein